MPLRMSVTMEASATPLFTPQRIGPGESGATFDFADSEDGILVVASCHSHDDIGLIFDLPIAELEVDDEDESVDAMLLGQEEFTEERRVGQVAPGAPYRRDVLVEIANSMLIGKLVVEHFIEN